MEAQRRNLAEARKLFRRALQVGALGKGCECIKPRGLLLLLRMVAAPGPNVHPSLLLFVGCRWTLATPRACWASHSWRHGPATQVQPSRQVFAHALCARSALHISAASGTRGAHTSAATSLVFRALYHQLGVALRPTVLQAYRQGLEVYPRSVHLLSSLGQLYTQASLCSQHSVCLAACTRQCLLPSLASITSRQAPWVQRAAPTGQQASLCQHCVATLPDLQAALCSTQDCLLTRCFLWVLRR